MSSGPKLPSNMAEQLMLLQEKLLAAQEELKKETVTGTAGGGAIKVTLTGDQRCTKIEIDSDMLKDADPGMLEDVLLSAINQALEDSRELAAKRLSPYAPNLG